MREVSCLVCQQDAGIWCAKWNNWEWIPQEGLCHPERFEYAASKRGIAPGKPPTRATFEAALKYSGKF